MTRTRMNDYSWRVIKWNGNQISMVDELHTERQVRQRARDAAAAGWEVLVDTPRLVIRRHDTYLQIYIHDDLVDR